MDLIERFLNETTTLATSSNETAEPPKEILGEQVEDADSGTLKITFAVYGSILLVGFVLFCWVRRRYPRPYQIRHWVNDLKSPLAAEQYGFFSWIWMHNTISEDEILEHCGLDALCYLRVLLMGFKVACLAGFNAFWLMPVYSSATKRSEPGLDRVERFATTYVAPQSKRFLATVIAAYMLFGYLMYLILKEFEWFIEKRHKYLQQAEPHNYTVYVRNIPQELRSNDRLQKFFSFSLRDENAVYEARVHIKAPILEKAVLQRSAVVSKLEHALYHEEIVGETPHHREYHLRDFSVVPSIPTYAGTLKEANEDISKRIHDIEVKMKGQQVESADDLFITDRGEDDPVKVEESTADDTGEENKNVLGQGLNMLTSTASSGVNLLANSTKVVASTATGLISKAEDGTFQSAAFVSFRSLAHKNAALQMVHHDKPFSIEVVEAPGPDDVFWNNVGREHRDLQLGNLSSLAATSALCLFWTIPMTFVAGIQSASDVEWLEPVLEAIPGLTFLFNLIAPLLVKVLNAMLPTILTRLAMLEGPVSSMNVESSLFTKLATFQIVQTFFVTALSGAIFKEAQEILKEPSKVFELLGEELPSMSVFFIQIVFVGTVITVVLETLRVVPLAMALIRKYLAPNLTKKERQTAAFGIRPLADVEEFSLADNSGQIVMNFIIMLVYAVIAPMTAFPQAFCFMLLYVSYRHQFIYIYPRKPDSGGHTWLNFMKIIMSCMLIAEVTCKFIPREDLGNSKPISKVSGLLTLKQAAIATPFMLPLIIITVLFNAYIRQQHFRVAQVLPTRKCCLADRKNGSEFDLSFLDRAYLQEELREKHELPENLSESRAVELELDVETELDVESTVLLSGPM